MNTNKHQFIEVLEKACVILYIYSILSLYQSSPEVGFSGKACYTGGALLQSTSAAHDSGEG